MSNIGHYVDQTTSTNAMIKTKENMEVVAAETDKDAAFMEETAQKEDEGICVVNEAVEVRTKGNRKALFIVVMLYIEHQTQGNNQRRYTVERYYCDDYLDGMKHTPQSATPQGMTWGQEIHRLQP